MNFDSFIRKLAASRGALTKTMKFLNEGLEEEVIDRDKIEIKRKTLVRQNKGLELLNEEIDSVYKDMELGELEAQYEKVKE